MKEPTAEEVEARLREASRASDLSEGSRLSEKIDMSGDGIRARLAEAAELLDVCRRLSRSRRA